MSTEKRPVSSDIGQGLVFTSGKGAMQSALSHHLTSLVHRTQKNLNTGVYPPAGQSTTSPIYQAGVGFSSSFQPKRTANFKVDAIDNNATIGYPESQNASRLGFRSTPTKQAFMQPNHLIIPGPVSHGAAAAASAKSPQYQLGAQNDPNRRSRSSFQQRVNSAVNNYFQGYSTGLVGP